MVAAEKKGGEIKDEDKLACLTALAGKLTEEGKKEVAFVRNNSWEKTKRLVKNMKSMRGFLVTGYKDKRSTWSQVVSGSRSSRERKTSAAPKKKEVVIVKATGGRYSQALEKIRVDLEKANIKVASIRKTKSGDVLMEAAGSANGQGQLREALGKSHNVRVAGDRSTVVIKGLDALSTKEEVLEAIMATLGKEAPIELGEMCTFEDTKAISKT